MTHNRLNRLLTLFLCALLLAFFFIWKKENDKPLNISEAEIIFCQTEDDANCAILLMDEYCIMIDTGEKKDAGHIISVLEDKGVKKIDCMFLTHPDKDHIGAASSIMEAFTVDEVVTPFFDGEKKRYDELLTYMNRKQIKKTTVSVKTERYFGDFSFEINPPKELSYEKSNDYSLAIVVNHGKNHILFPGDAQKERLKELRALDFSKVNLMVLPHHGRGEGSSVKLLKDVEPDLVIVTAKEPSIELSEALDKMDVSWLSSLDGDICLISRGKGYEIK